MGAPDVFLHHPSIIHQAYRQAQVDSGAGPDPTRSRWSAILADLPRRALALGRWSVALGLMAGAFLGGKLLLDKEPEILPVRLVTVEGDVHRLSSQQLQRTITEHLEGGLLTQDIKRLQRSVDELPWVRTATLRRVWPDRIVLNVEEYRPIARWGSDGLVTAEGEVFRPKGEDFPTTLPRLSGDDGQAPVIAGNYLRWRDRLAGLGLTLMALDRDTRGAWTLHLGQGLDLELGATRVEERLERFMRTWRQLAAAGRPAVVDLRYANGLAVRWAQGFAPGDAEVAQVETVERRPQAPTRSKSRNRG